MSEFEKALVFLFDQLKAENLYEGFAKNAERRINREGAIRAITHYVSKDTQGFRNTVDAGRIDLTFEQLVIQFSDLFPKVIGKVYERLQRYGYDD